MSSSTWSRITSTWTQLALSLLALCLFAVVVIYVRGTSTAISLSTDHRALNNFLLNTDVSTTLAVVRASQGLLSALMTGLLKNMFVLVQWNLMSSARGLSFHNLLALSPTTDSLGALAILRSRRSLMRWKSKVWLMIRVFLIGILWLSGLVLFFNTSIVTVYDTVHTYNATAGVGPFNASLVEPFTRRLRASAPAYPYEIVPFTYLAAVYFLVVNPLISTVASPVVTCLAGNQCVSYLLSGGLEMVAPWMPSGYDRHSMVRIDNAPAVQLDFWGPADDGFLETDCDDFGKTGFNIGIRLCMAPQPDDAGLRVGLFVCPQGIADSACSTASFPSKPNMTTHVSFYTRHATIIASRSNYSITSIEQTTSPPVLLPASSLDVSAYRQSLRWLLNFTAADIPPPTSIAQSFWSSRQQLAHPATFGILVQNFHSIVAFPFWLFQSNNWANPDLVEDTLVDTLPPQFYTTASIVEPVVKIRFDEGMFVLFVALQGVAMVFVWAVLGWVWFGGGNTESDDYEGGSKYNEHEKQQQEYHQPKTSSFPLWDIVFRARNIGGDLASASEEDLMKADDKEILELVRDSRVYYGTDTVRKRNTTSKYSY